MAAPTKTASSNDIDMGMVFLIGIAGSLIVAVLIVGGQAAFRYLQEQERDRKVELVEAEGREGGYDPYLVLSQEQQAEQAAHLDGSLGWADKNQTHRYVSLDEAKALVGEMYTAELADPALSDATTD